MTFEPHNAEYNIKPATPFFLNGTLVAIYSPIEVENNAQRCLSITQLEEHKERLRNYFEDFES